MPGFLVVVQTHLKGCRAQGLRADPEAHLLSWETGSVLWSCVTLVHCSASLSLRFPIRM